MPAAAPSWRGRSPPYPPPNYSTNARPGCEPRGGHSPRSPDDGDRRQDRLGFLIGAPRSGTTLLARMLSAHSLVYGRAEPHLITPIAHLGYFGKVQKAPYDAQNVEQAIHEIVAELPRGEGGYLDALRAYTDAPYAQMKALAPPGKRL